MHEAKCKTAGKRRDFLKGSALATGAFFINSKFSLKMLEEEPASPFTVPWLQPLRFPNYAISDAVRSPRVRFRGFSRLPATLR